MPIKPDYTIHGDKCHYGWDRSIEPVIKVDPGSVVEIEAVDAGGGQITTASTLEDVKNIDFDKVNPVTGPVYVEGAEPGDALKVTIMALKSSGWGWSAVIPGFGLLADQFEEPALYIWDYDRGFPGARTLSQGRQGAVETLSRHHRRAHPHRKASTAS